MQKNFTIAGQLAIPVEMFSDALRRRLTVTGTNYNGTPFGFAVYREDGNRVWVPRYSLEDHYRTALIEKHEQFNLNPRFPRFEGRLWPEQVKGANNALNQLMTHGGVFVNAKPGSGKTVVGVWLASVIKPNRTIILVDQINLIEQWAERIKEFCPCATVTFIMPPEDAVKLHAKYKQAYMIPGVRRIDLRGDFVLISAQTFVKHPTMIKADLLIVDEAHVFSAPTFSECIFNIDCLYTVALSANDTRPDGHEWIFRQMLGKDTAILEGKTLPARAMFYPVDAGPLRWADPYPSPNQGSFHKGWCTINKMQVTQYDCSFCCVARKAQDPSHPRCRSNWKSDEWDENSLERMMGLDPVYTGWILDVIKTTLEAKRDIFVFARLREPLFQLKGMIDILFGDVSGLYLGHATDLATKKRNEVALSKPITLCTYKKAGKGLDVQRKDGIIFASPVSKSALNQVIGRAERAQEGKKQPVVIHPIIPFVTSVARMKGCLAWYKAHHYDVTVQEDLSRRFALNR